MSARRADWTAVSMQLTTQFSPLADVQADCLIVTSFEDETPAGSLAQLDEALGGTLLRLRQSGDFAGKASELTPLLGQRGLAADRLLIAGLGKRAGVDRITLLDAAAGAARSLTGKPRKRIAFALPAAAGDLTWEDVALAVGVGLIQGCHGPGLRKREAARFVPDELCLVAPASAPANPIREAAHRAEIEGRAVTLARKLVNLPPCDLYPETFAQWAQKAAASVEVECTVLEEKQLEAERMGALLGVARGSDRPPRLVVLRYGQESTGRTLGLIGKGVTFDSGGLSLKTNEQMLDMKADMAGAAAVLAAVLAIAELRVPVQVLGVMALVENLPSGRALKLGDVLQARNGKTIEVLNTDAEGRLILADALSYAVDHQASHLVDLATLTGSCMVALGEEVAGLMGNNQRWCDWVLRAADHAGERAWQLPMFPLYGDRIKSHVADIKNVGGNRYGGAITAAKFLEEFVGGVPWVHLDIAGPAWAEHESPSRDPGGTGCFVRTLVELARMYSSLSG
jgi:leucyl aminopeptidase